MVVVFFSLFFSSAPAAFEESVRVCVDCKEKLDNLATHQPAAVSWTLTVHAIQFCPCVLCCSCVLRALWCWNLSSVYYIEFIVMLYAHTTHAMNHYSCMVDCSFVPRPPPSFLSLQQQKAGAVTEGWGSDGRPGQWRKAGAVTEGRGSDRRPGQWRKAWPLLIQCSYFLISAHSCSLVPWRLLYNDLRIGLAS